MKTALKKLGIVGLFIGAAAASIHLGLFLGEMMADNIATEEQALICGGVEVLTMQPQTASSRIGYRKSSGIYEMRDEGRIIGTYRPKAGEVCKVVVRPLA